MMKITLPLFIALRYWRAKSGDRFGRLVTNLASLGIVLGVMALVIVLSVMNGLESSQKKSLLTAMPHAIVAPLETEEQQPLFVLPDIAYKSVPINQTNVVIQSRQGIDAGRLIGVSERSDDPRLSRMREPKDLKASLPSGEFHVIIGSGLADQLHLKIGDKIRLMITENSQYTPFGRVPVQRLFTISEIYDATEKAGEATLFANLNDVGRLLRLADGEVQGQRLFLNDPFQVTELTRYFPEQQWQINDWREQKGEFFQAVRMEKNMMGLLISLIIVVAVSNIVTSLSLMVVDKQGEIAILQTQGLTKGQIMRIFIAQGAIVGILGAFIGGGLGILASEHLGTMIAWIHPQGVVLPILLSYSQVAIIVATSIGLSLLCTLYPAFQAAKIEPAEALRYE